MKQFLVALLASPATAALACSSNFSGAALSSSIDAGGNK
jgi:hypothetical protein